VFSFLLGVATGWWHGGHSSVLARMWRWRRVPYACAITTDNGYDNNACFLRCDDFG
jgi:hypothetical protein